MSAHAIVWRALEITRQTIPARVDQTHGHPLASLLNHNDPALGVTKGTRGHLTNLDPHHGEIQIRTDRGQTARLPHSYLQDGHVQLGYAITGHASQGITIDQAFVLATPQGPQREWGYVTLSRARRNTRLYVATTDLDLDEVTASTDGPGPLMKRARLDAPAAQPLATLQRRPIPQMDLET